jgi:uncharacterized protein (TIGR00369 family)
VTQFEPKRENYREAVEDLHARTALDNYLGVRLVSIEPGHVVAELDLIPELTQQHGFAHAGVLASIADTACGNAACSLMAEGEEVLSVNLNLSLMRPATGERLRAEGKVVKTGKRVYFTEADVFSGTDGDWKQVARVSIVMAVG